MAAEWERQEGETEPAFEAFRTFRDMGLARSIKGTYEALGKSKALITDWASRWRWHERARAYDNYVDRRAIEAELVIREASLAEYADALNHSLQAKLVAFDQIASEELRRLMDAQARGEAIDLMTLKRLMAIVNEGDTLARRSAGLPTQFRSETSKHTADEERVYYVGD